MTAHVADAVAKGAQVCKVWEVWGLWGEEGWTEGGAHVAYAVSMGAQGKCANYMGGGEGNGASC